MSGNNKKKESEWMEVGKAFSMILQIGISMMIPMALCLFIGYELDKWIGTHYMTIIFLVIGMAAGIRSVYTITKGFYAKDLEKEIKQQKYFDDLYKQHRQSQMENKEDK